MESERLKPILEAALLASPQPLTPVQLAELFDEIARPPTDLIAQALDALAGDCAERGVELVQVGSGFRYQIKTEVFPQISALWTERQTRYSRALLETLSLIAYRQPITRGEIEQIRGVAVSTSILRTLEEREWVRVVGHRDVPGRPALYGTTKAFLDYFALKSLDELPPLSALRDLDNLEPELALEVAAPGDPVQSASQAETAAEQAESDGVEGAPAVEPPHTTDEPDIDIQDDTHRNRQDKETDLEADAEDSARETAGGNEVDPDDVAEMMDDGNDLEVRTPGDNVADAPDGLEPDAGEDPDPDLEHAPTVASRDDDPSMRPETEPRTEASGPAAAAEPDVSATDADERPAPHTDHGH